MKCLWIMLITATLPVLSATADTVPPLRVLQTGGDTFDYTFTTYTPAADGQWTLAFNHRHGQTVFARVGESVGSYRITAFEPGETQRFNPAINTTSRQKSGWVTLEAPDGTHYRLTVDQALSLPGRRATLVTVPSGQTWSVRTGDRLQVADTVLTVTQIADDVLVSSGTDRDAFAVPILQPEEAEQLRAERERREQLARQPPSAGFPEPDVPAATARVTPASRPQDAYQEAVRNLPNQPSSQGDSYFVFSRESRYPVEYDVIVLRDPDGSWQPMYLPRRFETFYGRDPGSRQCPFGSRPYGYRQDRYGSRPSVFSPPPPYLRIPHPDTQRLYHSSNRP